jgi:hypothetical protein
MKHWSFCWETMRNLYMVWGVPIWEIAIVRWSMCLQKPGSVFSIHLAPNPRRPRPAYAGHIRRAAHSPN